MRNKLKRYYGMGHLHFLTFSCYRRKPLLGTVRARNRFVKMLEEVRARFGFLLVGYVVMPDHVHLLVSEPRRGTPSTVLQALKQRVSRALRGKRRRVPEAQLRLRFPEPGPEPQRFWQRRFYDFNVWSRAKRRDKLSYMHENPVKRKLVQDGVKEPALRRCKVKRSPRTLAKTARDAAPSKPVLRGELPHWYHALAVGEPATEKMIGKGAPRARLY